jgi:hypothetical protein
MNPIDQFMSAIARLAVQLGIPMVVVAVKTPLEVKTMASKNATTDIDLRRSIAAKCNLTVPEDRIPEVGWGEPG